MKFDFLPVMRSLSTRRIQVPYYLRTVSTVMLLALPIYSHALPSDANQPIKLLADKATYSERTGVTSYSGSVIITQGSLKLTADNITVNL